MGNFPDHTSSFLDLLALIFTIYIFLLTQVRNQTILFQVRFQTCFLFMKVRKFYDSNAKTTYFSFPQGV